MIWIKLKDAIELKEVLLVESYPPEDMLLVDGLYRYLLQPGKEDDDQCKRVTNRIWSKTTCRLSLGNQVMYYLADRVERAFMKEDLMLIPEDMELPPDCVQRW